MKDSNDLFRAGELPADPFSDGRKPEIRIDVDQERMVMQAIDALVESGSGLYQRGGRLVRIMRHERKTGLLNGVGDVPLIADVPHAILAMELSSAADWVRVSDKGELRPANPPALTVSQVESLGRWDGVRVLTGIVDTPVMRADGTILDAAGYDEATGLVFEPTIKFDPIPTAPSRADATAAVNALKDALVDFPFAGPEHLSAMLALVLTPFARHAIDGCCPITLVEAPTRGSGKGLAAEVAGEIAMGTTLPIIPQTCNDEEFRKRVMALALADVRLACLDNLNTIGGPVIDAILTATVWQDRILGASEVRTVPLKITWIGTGNNVEMRGDIVRRINLVRLEPDCSNPDSRTGFRHDPLIPWVRRNRARLVKAALTILRAHAVAGRPTGPMTPWGRFEAWSTIIRGALIWAGEPDPYLSRAKLSDGSAEDSAAETLLRTLAEVMEDRGRGAEKSMSAGEVFEAAAAPKHFALRSALLELLADRGSKDLSTFSVGYLFRTMRDRWYGRLRVCKTDKVGGGCRWYLDSKPEAWAASSTSAMVPTDEVEHVC